MWLTAPHQLVLVCARRCERGYSQIRCEPCNADAFSALISPKYSSTVLYYVLCFAVLFHCAQWTCLCRIMGHSRWRHVEKRECNSPRYFWLFFFFFYAFYFFSLSLSLRLLFLFCDLWQCLSRRCSCDVTLTIGEGAYAPRLLGW